MHEKTRRIAIMSGAVAGLALFISAAPGLAQDTDKKEAPASAQAPVPAPSVNPEKEKTVIEQLEKLTKTEKLTIEGKAFVRYWYDIQDTTLEAAGVEEAHKNSFELWRFYFGLRSQLTKWLTIRFTADVGSEKDVKTSTAGEDGHQHTVAGDSAYHLFVKFAWLNIEPVKGLHLRAGIVENPYHEFLDSFWGYRYVAKNVGEDMGLYNSADLGGYIKYQMPLELGELAAGVANGAGYKKALDDNTNKLIWANLSLNPLATVHKLLKKFTIGGYIQYPMKIGDYAEKELMVGMFVGWSHPWITVGYQPLLKWTWTKTTVENVTTTDQSLGVGHGVYLRFDTPYRVGLLAKFAYWDTDKDSDSERALLSVLAGLSYSPIKFFSVAASCATTWESDDNDPATQEKEKEIKLLISSQFEY